MHQHPSTALAQQDAYGILNTNLALYNCRWHPRPLRVICKTSIHVQTAIKYFDYLYVSTVYLHFIRISAVVPVESVLFTWTSFVIDEDDYLKFKHR